MGRAESAAGGRTARKAAPPGSGRQRARRDRDWRVAVRSRRRAWRGPRAGDAHVGPAERRGTRAGPCAPSGLKIRAARVGRGGGGRHPSGGATLEPHYSGRETAGPGRAPGLRGKPGASVAPGPQSSHLWNGGHPITQETRGRLRCARQCCGRQARPPGPHRRAVPSRAQGGRDRPMFSHTPRGKARMMRW